MGRTHSTREVPGAVPPGRIGRGRAPIWALAALALLGTHAAARGGQVYLALGDSVTFGIDPSTPASLAPSSGDQGFVRPFADALASMNGGVRPEVLNLAISGELSTSFFNATPPAGWPNRAWQLNRNYADGATPQHDAMIASIAAIHAAGDSVGYASLLFGSNDFLYLSGTPDFQAASPAGQQAMIVDMFGVVFSNYLAAASELKALAPEARLLLPGYYNPFPSFAPQHAAYDQVVQGFNAFVASNAPSLGATYVDLYTPFVGRELLLTNIASGDVHPNQEGYAAIADAFTRAAAVPEPSSVLSISIGVIAIGLGARRRRTRSARPLSEPPHA